MNQQPTATDIYLQTIINKIEKNYNNFVNAKNETTKRMSIYKANKYNNMLTFLKS